MAPMPAFFPTTQNNKDFALLVRLGMRPIDVPRSATFDAAELIGVTDRGLVSAREPLPTSSSSTAIRPPESA